MEKIRRERINQEKTWGDQSEHPSHVWLTILGEEFGEICQALLVSDDKNLEQEIIQLAAAAVAWLEGRELLARDLGPLPIARDKLPKPVAPPNVIVTEGYEPPDPDTFEARHEEITGSRPEPFLKKDDIGTPPDGYVPPHDGVIKKLKGFNAVLVTGPGVKVELNERFVIFGLGSRVRDPMTGENLGVLEVPKAYGTVIKQYRGGRVLLQPDKKTPLHGKGFQYVERGDFARRERQEWPTTTSSRR